MYGIYRDTHVATPPEDLTIDDLGSEPVSVTYGQREEVMATVLADRYEHWQRHGRVTRITTNLDGRALDARYGRRVTDRLAECCVIVRFAGPSARRPAKQEA